MNIKNEDDMCFWYCLLADDIYKEDKAAREGLTKEEEKALRVCRIEFAPYPSGKYNKLEGEDGPGRVAAYEQCRKDLPALSSWSDDEIEATFTYMQSTPSELLFNSPIGPFLVLSGLSMHRS